MAGNRRIKERFIMKRGILIALAIIFTLGFLSWGVVRIVKTFDLNFGCLNYLKRAADANTIEMAKPQLDKAIKYFRQGIYERINCVAKYCNPKNIHFEKMLCSLLCLSKNMEGILYDVITSRMKDKEREYSKMPLQTIEQIYGAIEANIPDKYIYNPKCRAVKYSRYSS